MHSLILSMRNFGLIFPPALSSLPCCYLVGCVNLAFRITGKVDKVGLYSCYKAGEA